MKIASLSTPACMQYKGLGWRPGNEAGVEAWERGWGGGLGMRLGWRPGNEAGVEA